MEANGAGRFAERAILIGRLAGLAALLSLTSCGEDGGPAGTVTPAPKAWAFMLYDAADLIHVDDPIHDFSARVASGRNIDVLVLQDTRSDSARLWYIDSGHVLNAVRELGEVNTGRGETLAGFLEYAAQHYPAERSILAVYGHGQGWLGACEDASNGDDYLSMDEMRSAVAAAGGVDLILFTGPCLMGAVESAYELRHCCEAYVGSENLSYYCWWDYPLGGLCAALEGDPAVGTGDLARAAVELVWEERGRCGPLEWPEALTMSAIETDRLDEAVALWDSVAAHYLDDPGRLRAAMDEIGHEVTVFHGQYPDMIDLAGELYEAETADSTRALLDAVVAALEGAVIANCHADSLTGAGGLTIYFPFRSHSGCTTLYGSQSGLDFILDTCWDELLRAYPYPPLQ